MKVLAMLVLGTAIAAAQAGPRFEVRRRSQLPEQNAGTRPGAESVTTAADDPAGGILTAMQDDLGLKLEPSRGPLEFVVISVDRPTVN